MNPDSILSGTASLFLALGDKTRLRLLNLMRDREVCVSSFTGVLEQSQPLVSRHLAYLRNSGIVVARREGKWIHYSISDQLDENSRLLLGELFKWMETKDALRSDRETCLLLTGEADNVSTSKQAPKPKRQRRRSTRPLPLSQPMLIQETEEDQAFEGEQELTFEGAEVEVRDDYFEEEDLYPAARHNEIEDFLL